MFLKRKIEMNLAQNKQFHKLLTQLGQNDPESKANIVLGATKGRSNSSRDMTWYEADECIKFLRKQVADKENDRCDRMRKKVIGCLRTYGFVRYDAKGELKADMSKIYDWVLKYGYLHKDLNEYTAAELPKLVTQAEALNGTKYG